MKYLINKIEIGQTATGVKKATVDLTSSEGQEITGVTLWASNWPLLDNLAQGQEVEGEYQEKQNGQWLNKNLYPPKPPVQAGGFKGNGAGIAGNMQRKEAGIEKAQNNKEHGIKVAGTMGGATNLAIAEFNSYNNPNTTRPTLEFLIEKWRKYLWANWDKDEETVPF